MNTPLNILLICTDQHRLDHVSFGPGSRLDTPHIARIAESAAFTGCITASPMCQPARAALLTGKYPHQIGMATMSGDLSRQHGTYLRAMQEAGYWTACVGKMHLLQGWDWFGKIKGGHDLVKLGDAMRCYGIDHLWEVSGKLLARRDFCDWAMHLHRKGLFTEYLAHIDRCGGGQFTPREDRPDRVTPWPFDEGDYVDVITADKTIEAIRARDRTRPFMLFSSFCGPHVPYDPPARYLAMFADTLADPIIDPDGKFSPAYRALLVEQQRAYKAMIRLIDDQIGRILDTVVADGLWENTAVLFVSDHGEMLGDHYLLQKGYPQWQSLSVPLAIRVPGHAERFVNASPVELTDVTATLLSLAGLDPVAALGKSWPSYHDIVPGRSLLPTVQGDARSVRDFAFAESDANWHSPQRDPDSNWQVITDGRWKYVRYVQVRNSSPDDFFREELFDLEADPNELHNLAAEPAHKKRIARCRARRDWVISTTPPAQLSWAPVEKWSVT